ncbi:aldo/keto reductase [Ornithinimicrobium sediminis]|uniref:aldo/keto reductase n=1 Tax=Ornithinimicrobium sediminis TaxID=2904603 RepID=UPI001E34DE9F|nr:aldo/keto reductase [Ornithinimicrobium sediminis]MCE0487373.1 aldo/keto reductase [Ornithinimicrobium sediminis]
MTDLCSRAAAVSAYGPLGLGSANAGNLYSAISDEQAHDLFAAAWAGGIRHFDTAPHYGLGLAEERLGAFLQTVPREEFVVSTKVGRRLEDNPDFAGERDPCDQFDAPATRRRVVDYSAGGIGRSLDESLARMGLDRVDTLYVHDPEQHGPENTVPILESAMPAVCALRDEGVVACVGVGTGSVEAARHAVAIGGIDVLMLAGRYTLLEQPAHPELLEACRDQGVGIVNTAQFNSGLLATPRPGENAHYEYSAAPAEKLERAVRLAEVCERHGVELPTAALQFGLQNPQVVAVVMGAATAEQVRENIARIHQPVPAALWAELRQEGLIP